MSRLVVTVLMASSHNSGPFSSRPTPGAASLGPECADAAGGGAPQPGTLPGLLCAQECTRDRGGSWVTLCQGPKGLRLLD